MIIVDSQIIIMIAILNEIAEATRGLGRGMDSSTHKIEHHGRAIPHANSNDVSYLSQVRIRVTLNLSTQYR